MRKISVKNQSELNAMIEHVPMAIFLVDKDRRVRRANVAAEKFVGVKNKKMAGLRAGEAFRCMNSFRNPKGCGFSPDCKDCLIRNTVNDTFRKRKGFKKVETKIAIKSKGKKQKLDLLVSTSLVNVSNEQLSLVCVEDITERRRTERSLQQTSTYLEKLINHANAPIIVWNPEHEIMRANYAFEQISGYSVDELIGKKMVALFPRGNEKESMDKILSNTEGANKQIIEIPIRLKNGKMRMLLWSSANIYNNYYNKDKRKLIATIAQGQDITELKKREEEVTKLNRILKAKGDSNKAIIFSKNEAEYLEEICRIIIEECGYKMAWIGLAENDEKKNIRPVASAGFSAGYLETLNITWSAGSPRGKGPTGTAVRTGKISTCTNILTDPLFKPWRKEAKKRGYASSIVFPLKTESEILGALSIYSKDPDPFSDSEIKILKELSEDIVYGITFFRLKAANKKAEKEIKHMASFPRLNPNPVIEVNVSGQVTFANEATENILKEIGAKHKITEFLPKGMRSILLELKKNKLKHFYREVKIGNYYFGETIHLEPQYNVVRIYATNITRRKTAEELIEYSSTHDILTGVYNRYFFEKQLQKFRKSRSFNGGVIMIDVNGLKKINDKFGHLAGDRIIKRTADFLVAKMRKKDLIARFGGDEFCVLLPSASPNEIRVLANRLKTRKNRTSNNGQMSISVGSAYAPKGKDIDEALKMADEKMYKNKISSRK